jgi:MYXO-CTERM domain-containing protein
LSMPAFTSRAATTPVFRQNSVVDGSVLFGDHDVDITTGSPANVVANLPSAGPFLPPSGPIPASPSLLAPWPSGGMTLGSGTGSSKGKGGAGHTEGSNLAKITFPSGAGLDQTDPSHAIGASRYRINFNYVWDINSGTLGPPMSGTFSVPIGVKVGTGPAAYVKFEYEIHWDARINNVIVPDVRSPFVGSQTFVGAGTYVSSATAPGSAFTPTSITAGNGNLIALRGFIGFEANNDDSRSLIEILGSTLKDVDGELRADPTFNSLYNDPSHPEFRLDAASGFEEAVPEPSAGLLAAVGAAVALVRRRRREQPRM